jgi:hypothetical protein
MDEFKLIKSPLAPLFQRGGFGWDSFPKRGSWGGSIPKRGKF